jgi:type I restriction enzyme S subunit
MTAAPLQALNLDQEISGKRMLPRYGNLAACSIRFVPRLPSHWRVEKLKHVASVRFSSVDKKSDEGEVPVRLCNYTDVYNRDVIFDDSDFMHATATKAEIDRFSLRKGDVLITKDSEEWNDIAVPAYVTADMPGVLCGYHLALIRPNPAEFDGAFLSRAFTANGIRQQFHIAANGITRYGLPNLAIASALFPVPPLDEQRAISAFLDHETVKIDTLIAKKERLHALLHEKRSALIERAVSKVSAQLVKLRRALSRRPKNGISPPPGVSGEGVPTFSIAAVRNGTIDIVNNLKVAAISKTDAIPYLVRRGDVLVVRGNANQSLVGTSGIVSEHPEYCVYPDLLIRLTPLPHVDSRYLVLVLNSGIVRSQVESLARTSNGTLKISGGDVCSLQVPIPSLEVQSALLRDVNQEATKLNELSAAITTHIGLLKAHRASLVTAAVTGQIDVRQYGKEAT